MSPDSASSKRGSKAPAAARRPRRRDGGGESRLLVGWREWVELPELGGGRVKAKIDTGARTSAIHAWRIETYERRGALWVRFEFHPLQRDEKTSVVCEAPVLEERLVRSSSGHAERRLVILTTLALGGESWPMQLSLARRDEMGFRLLIGRSALHGRAVVDPSRSFLCSRGARRIPRGKRKSEPRAP